MYDPEEEKQRQIGEKKKKSGGFQSMGFNWQILKSILNSGYKQPTPIQRKAIPEILLGKDVVAMARTGSGKTAAFLLPMLQRLTESSQNKTQKSQGPKALIMSPTRELALQTFKFSKQFGKYCDFKAAVILGGDKIEDQFETMHENPDIIIATPGRFLHICVEMNLKLNSIEYVVFDEADRLFEMGFKEQLNEILTKLPTENRQTLLFSATLPQSLVEFARAGLQNPTLIRLDVESKLSDKLKLAFFHSRIEDKLPFLIYLLNNVTKSAQKLSQSVKENAARISQTIIFVATRHHVEFLKDLLENLGFSVSYVYSCLDQAARQINIAKFQQKKTSIMIVTDVAARGIDIPMLDNVINFNFPAKAKLFVHRVGRVARAGNYGNAYSLVTSDELPYMHELFDFLSKEIRFASDEMNPEDWNEVYGSVPQSIIDVEKDTIRTLLEEKIDLKCAFEVQENAYKQYLKSRPLSGAASVRAAKNIRQLHPFLPIHPLLKANSDLKNCFEAQSNLLDQLKNYKTKSTIFEINKTSNNQSVDIMRKKRQHHDQVVEKFQQKDLDGVSLFHKNMYSIERDMFNERKKQEEAEEELNDEFSFESENLVIKISNDDSDRSGKKRLSKAEKRKLPVVDAEHYIPYKPKNFNTEKALGINSNFNREMSDAAMDMVLDDRDDMRRNLQKQKWDRKKKKFVSVQSTLDKEKKIRTESGNYIKASYKSNLYSKWLKNQKVMDKEESDDEQVGQNKKNKKFFGSKLAENRYFGSGKSNKFKKPLPGSKRKSSDDGPVENKRFKNSDGTKKPKRFSTGLKNKDQILKERRRKEKFQKFQKKKKPSKGSKSRSKKMSQNEFSELVSDNNTNSKKIKCIRCDSFILSVDVGFFKKIESGISIPSLRQKRELASPNDAEFELLNNFWLVKDAFSFENIGFTNTVQNKKYLICADCEIGPLGVQNLETPNEFYLSVDRF
ncbi:ATP-dependent RNA helicase DDX54 [Brachionus plicatilis]|uniref:RNA helicase n=1 Tax=Brachionus plicatilis TaxID=10195 RepID=A0A3M7QXS2_BRAPC|nr:ATP-dependent RNA helicase DDX54 [Brachionus plicatilis]